MQLPSQAQELTSENPFTSYRTSGQLPQHSRRLPVTLSHKLRLSDDVREFWGFYLLRGSRISISACARYAGKRFGKDWVRIYPDQFRCVGR